VRDLGPRLRIWIWAGAFSSLSFWDVATALKVGPLFLFLPFLSLLVWWLFLIKFGLMLNFLNLLGSLLLNKGCVTQCGLAICIKKASLRQKKNYGNSNISPCKNIIFQKSSKRNQNPSRYSYNAITNLKFQHKPKYHVSKSSYKNGPIIYYLGAKIP